MWTCAEVRHPGHRHSGGEIVYDGPTANVTQEILDSIYNGASVPQAGE